MALRNFFIRFLASSLRGIARGSRFILRRLGFLEKASMFVARLFFRAFIFPFYKLYFYFKYKILNIYTPAKSKVFYFLNKTYIIHVFIIILAMVVIVDNLNAQDIRQENYGDKTIVYGLITKEVYEEAAVETSIDYPPGEVVANYLDKSATAESEKNALGMLPRSDSYVTDFSTTTEGGAAVSKPNIIRPVTIEEAQTIAAATDKRTDITKYTVVSGDTLSSIAKKFGISVATLLSHNGLTERSVLKLGMTLEILPTNGVVHKVVRGETLGSIAQKYGIASSEIISFNNLNDAAAIKIGQSLMIPGAKALAVAPVSLSPKQAGQTVKNNQVAPITKLFIAPSERVEGSGMIWPAGVRRISQYFSWRHRAIDVAGPTGTPVYASDGGTVIYSGWSTGYGNNVRIDHGNGITTLYGHASKLFVAKGDVVVKGQTIMAMGSTGWSTGPHVHFEVRVKGVLNNPLSYVK